MRSSEVFEPHVGSAFVVAPSQRCDPVTLELVRIIDRSNTQVEAYSLMFLGPKAGCFDQGIQEMTHAELGTLSMFLTPILSPGLGEHLIRYEAVFSRLRSR